MMSTLENQIEILFVHLGPPPPKILHSNVRWLKAKFPGVTINLATDAKLGSKDFEGLFVHRFSSRSEFYEMKKSPHSSVFRQGYWLHTMRRLLAIEEFHRVKPNVPLLQIETDVLLLDDFPFGGLAKVNKIAWPPVNAEHDAPALIYSPNLRASKWLAQKLYEQIRINPHVTDMSALKQISKKYPEDHLYLPVGPGPLVNSDLAPKSIQDFDGVFDGATLGRWLTGIDPRNNWGVVERYKYFANEHPEIMSMKFVFQNNRLCFRDLTSGTTKRVYNLHVHSKNEKLFSPYHHTRVLQSLVRKIRPRVVYSFSIIGFLGALDQLVEAGIAKLRKLTTARNPLQGEENNVPLD